MMTMAPTASAAISTPDVPPLVSAAGLVDGEGAALVGVALVGAEDVGEGLGLDGDAVGLAAA